MVLNQHFPNQVIGCELWNTLFLSLEIRKTYACHLCWERWVRSSGLNGPESRVWLENINISNSGEKLKQWKSLTVQYFWNIKCCRSQHGAWEDFWGHPVQWFIAWLGRFGLMGHMRGTPSTWTWVFWFQCLLLALLLQSELPFHLSVFWEGKCCQSPSKQNLNINPLP